MTQSRKRLLIGLGVVALIAIGGLLLFLVARNTPQPSPAAVLQGVPAYPNAQNTVVTPTLSIQPPDNYSYDAAAERTFETTATDEQVLAFFDDWSQQNNWFVIERGFGSPIHSYTRLDSTFQGVKLRPTGGPILNGPWVEIDYKNDSKYAMSIKTLPGQPGGRTVDIIVSRYRPH